MGKVVQTAIEPTDELYFFSLFTYFLSLIMLNFYRKDILTSEGLIDTIDDWSFDSERFNEATEGFFNFYF